MAQPSGYICLNTWGQKPGNNHDGIVWIPEPELEPCITLLENSDVS